jgi:hypothetical protein
LSARAQPRQRWIEAAQIGVDHPFRSKTIKDGRNRCPDPQPVKPQHPLREQPSCGFAVKRLQARVDANAGFAAAAPALFMQGKEIIECNIKPIAADRLDRRSTNGGRAGSHLAQIAQRFARCNRAQRAGNDRQLQDRTGCSRHRTDLQA